MGNSCSWVQGEVRAPVILLRGVPIPVVDTFRQPGIDVAIEGSWGTRRVFARHLEAGRSALRRLPQLATLGRRMRAVGTLVTLPALHGWRSPPSLTLTLTAWKRQCYV